ncbi:response regulator transcription factor, partial|nr:response regulator transcription factor [Escherichia coli]
MARILLIEDDDGTADEIGLELTASGHDVTRVAALEPARALSAGEPFDLLILDRQLPDGEGLELRSGLRRNGERTPALVLSALGSLDDRVRGLRAGGDDYLPKPFALVELIARVEALLRRPNDT